MNKGILKYIDENCFNVETVDRKNKLFHILPTRVNMIKKQLENKIGCEIEWTEDGMNRVTGVVVIDDPYLKLEILEAVKQKDLIDKFNQFSISKTIIKTNEQYVSDKGKFLIFVYYKREW